MIRFENIINKLFCKLKDNIENTESFSSKKFSGYNIEDLTNKNLSLKETNSESSDNSENKNSESSEEKNSENVYEKINGKNYEFKLIAKTKFKKSIILTKKFPVKCYIPTDIKKRDYSSEEDLKDTIILKDNKEVSKNELEKIKKLQNYEIEKYFDYDYLETYNGNFIYIFNSTLYKNKTRIDNCDNFILRKNIILYNKNDEVFYYDISKNNSPKNILKNFNLINFNIENNKLFLIGNYNEKLIFKFLILENNFEKTIIIDKSFKKYNFKFNISFNYNLIYFYFDEYIVKVNYSGDLVKYNYNSKMFIDNKKIIKNIFDRKYINQIYFKENKIYKSIYSLEDDTYIQELKILEIKNYKYFTYNNKHIFFDTDTYYIHEFNENLFKINDYKINYIPITYKKSFIKNNRYYIDKIKILNEDIEKDYFFTNTFVEKNKTVYILKKVFKDYYVTKNYDLIDEILYSFNGINYKKIESYKKVIIDNIEYFELNFLKLSVDKLYIKRKEIKRNLLLVYKL